MTDQLQNTVAPSMSPTTYSEPTVHFFGWNEAKNDLTKDLLQPEGSLFEMRLDSMKHAIIMNKGEVDPYRIIIGLPPGIHEYIFIVKLPGIVFVARYLASQFDDLSPGDLCPTIKTMAGRMSVKVAEIFRKDGPHDTMPAVKPELVIYHPAVFTNASGEPDDHYALSWMKYEFNNGGVRLETKPFPSSACDLVIELNNKGERATHNVKVK